MEGWKYNCLFTLYISNSDIFIKGLNTAYLRRTVASCFCGFADTQLLNLPVVQDFLMSFLIGLFSLIFTQSLRPFNPLFLPLAAAQSVFM